MNEMVDYRAYLLSTSDHMREVRGFKSTDDASACAEANYMLRGSDLAAVEVYQGWRLILRRREALTGSCLSGLGSSSLSLVASCF
jgi:hypothetical protein